MGSNAQQYCLRWNNHQSNLLTVFDELLQNEAFTDVTLVCEGGSPIKCHRMVLAACSPYFQNIFTVSPCKHPVVVLDVKHTEIKAILEYMYRGEVNVAHDQLAALLKVAETFKVKGLVEEKRGDAEQVHEEPKLSPTGVSPSSTNNSSNVHSSSNNSPPHSTNGLLYKNHYNNLYGKAPERNSRMNLPMWPGLTMPHHPAQIPQNQNHTNAAATAAAAMLSSCYEAGGPDMNPLKRKKMSSLLMNRDTPILRTVLGQADSSQPVSLVCHGGSSPDNVNSNGIEERHEKHIKNEPSENAQSPYTDNSMLDEDDKSKLGIPLTSPHAYQGDARGVSGIAPYVPSNQKPEWKRYKQYTRNDILSAIEAVKNGMSALQSAKLYGVPSRTLYDKVKKLGITPNKHFKRGSNGSKVCFPYGLTGTNSPYMDGSDENGMNNNSSLLEASNILQHALDSRGCDEREAMAAMAAHAAMSAMSGHSASPNNNHARSPSPSPTLLKYMRLNSLTPSPAPGSEHNHSETNGSSERDREEDDDHVEDLSVSARKHQESRVIMPPMNISTIIKKEEMLKETLREEMRREVSVENAE